MKTSYESQITALRTSHRLLGCSVVLLKDVIITTTVTIATVKIWLLEFCHHFIFRVLSQFIFFMFCHNLSFNFFCYIFLVLFQFVFFSLVTIWVFEFCHNLNFKFCHNLSFSVLFKFDFFSFVMFWVFFNCVTVWVL